jgi:hypothetical protein
MVVVVGSVVAPVPSAMRPGSFPGPAAIAAPGSNPEARLDTHVAPLSTLFHRSPWFQRVASRGHADRPPPASGGEVPVVCPATVGHAYTPLTSQALFPVPPSLPR